MADDTPQNIKYIIEANIQAQRQLEQFIKTLGQATKGAEGLQLRIKSLQDTANQAMGTKTAQQAKMVRGSLGALATGGYDALAATSANKGLRAQIDADGAVQKAKNDEAEARRLKYQLKLLEQEIEKKERLVQLAKQLNALGRDTPEFNEGLNTFGRNVPSNLMLDKNGKPVTGVIKSNRLKSMVSQVANGGGFAEDLAYQGVASISPMDRSRFNELVQLQKELATFSAADTENKQRGVVAMREQKRLAAELRAQTATDKSINRNFRDHDAPRLRDIADPVARKTMYDSLATGYAPGLSAAGKASLDNEFKKLDDAVQRAARKREAAVIKSEEERFDKMHANANRDNMAYDARQAGRGKRAEDQAVNSNMRNSAFNGAGLFATQAQLLGNYATMGALIGSIGFLAQYTVEFETSMKQLQAISTATDGEMKDLDATITTLARNSKFSANEIAEAATVMAQAGLSAKQIDQSIEAVSNLAIGTGTDLATAVDVVTSSMTIFDLQTSEAARVANTLTAAMNLSKLTMDKFSLGLQYSGNVAETLGIKYNELAALLGGMADAGIRSGSTLGTGFRQLLLDLQAPTDKAKGVFERLGLSSEQLDIESQGIFRVLTNLKEAGLTTADATEAFEVRAVSAFKALMNQLPHIKELNESILMTEAATKASGTQMDTMSAQWNRFTQGAGNAFYKSTALIRDGLKGLFGALAGFMGLLEAIAPVLTVVTTLSLSFFTAWALVKLYGLVTGLAAFKAALTAVQTAQVGATITAGGLKVALAALLTPVNIIGLAITAITLGFSIFSANSEQAAVSLETLRETSNRAKGDFDATREVIDSLDTSLEGLVKRYGALSGSASEELKTEIVELMNRFSQYGLQLDATKDDLNSVILKSAELRTELSRTNALQAQIHASALGAEQRGMAEQGLKQITTGQFESGAMSRVSFDDAYNLTQKLGNKAGLGDQRLMFKNAGASLGWLYGTNGMTAEQLSALSPEALNLRRADLGKLQSALGNEQLQMNRGAAGKPTLGLSKGELADAIRSADAAASYMSQVFAIVNNLSNKGKEVKFADQRVARSSVEGTAGFANMEALIGIGKGKLDNEISKRLKDYSLSPDRKTEDLTDLGAEWDATLKTLETAKTSMIDGWVTDLKITREEAEKLFVEGPLYDNYKYLMTATSRELKKLDPETRKRVAAAFGKAQAAQTENMDTIVRQSRLPNSMDIPTGAIGSLYDDTVTPNADGVGAVVSRRPMDTAVKMFDDAFTGAVKAARAKFDAEFPHAFEYSEGKSKDPAGMATWFSIAKELEQKYKQGKNDIYTNYNRDYTSKSDTEKKLKDAEAEKLRKEIEAKKAELAKIRGGMDDQTSTETNLDVQAKYKKGFEELTALTMALEAVDWDNSTWKQLSDPELLAFFRADNMAAARRTLAANEGKVLSDIDNTTLDTQGRETSRAARARRSSNEQVLAGLISDPTMVGPAAMAAKGKLAGELLDSIVADFTTEFWNNPANREKRGSAEVQEELDQKLSEYLIQRTTTLIDISSAATQNALYNAGTRVNELSARAGSYDSSINTGRVSNTQKYLDGKALRAAQEQQLGANVGIYQNNGKFLQGEYDKLSKWSSIATPGSAEALAAAARMSALQKEMTQNTKDLTSATLAYGAALEKVTEPKWGDMLQGAIDQWAESSGALLSMNETIADGLPGLFTNAASQMSQAMGDIASGARDTGDAMEDMARSILRSMLDIVNQMIANAIIIATLKALGLVPSMPGVTAPGAGSGGGLGSGLASAASAVAGKAGGGMIDGGIPNRDSVLTPTMPGEFVMKKSAVDFIGSDNLHRMNQTGRMANEMAVTVAGQQREPDMVNVYVMAPEEKPSLGPKDVIVAFADDVQRGGITKKLIKAVAMGAMG
jgi:TP901 family phage tail tape measure protein